MLARKQSNQHGGKTEIKWIDVKLQNDYENGSNFVMLRLTSLLSSFVLSLSPGVPVSSAEMESSKSGLFFLFRAKCHHRTTAWLAVMQKQQVTAQIIKKYTRLRGWFAHNPSAKPESNSKLQRFSIALITRFAEMSTNACDRNLHTASRERVECEDWKSVEEKLLVPTSVRFGAGVNGSLIQCSYGAGQVGRVFFSFLEGNAREMSF